MPADVRVSAEDQICPSGEWNNGAGPMWCYGASTIVREGDAVFASVNEVDPDATPLCNTRMRLYRRPDGGGWERMYADDGLEREPCMLVRTASGDVVASTNPSIGARGEAEEGPHPHWCRPRLLEFDAHDPTAAPQTVAPEWDADYECFEHSYRGFAGGAAGGQFLTQQVQDGDTSHLPLAAARRIKARTPAASPAC